jgi:hypothetical protein
MDIQKTHAVELDFFEIFLPYSFRLIGPQTKQVNMHPCSPKIGLNFLFAGFWTLGKQPLAAFSGLVTFMRTAVNPAFTL